MPEQELFSKNELIKQQTESFSETKSLEKSLEIIAMTVGNLSASNKNLSEHLAKQNYNKTIECQNNKGTINIIQFVFDAI